MVMKFRLYKEYGATNSVDIFNAFEQGLRSQGLVVSQTAGAIPVIWSVLWHGRMLPNRNIYHTAIKHNRPVVIIEVGNLRRGITWRIGVNHINQQGIFGNRTTLDYDRPRKLNMEMQPVQLNRKPDILIAAQHRHSLQWEGMPSMSQWVFDTVKQLQLHTDRPIVIRPHPRSPFSLVHPSARVIAPQRVPNTYDDFNISYDAHCVINHNSGPGVQAVIQGTPVVVDASSLAHPVSNTLADIESVQMPDRTEWFTQLCHTEWTLEEIAQGLPIKRLLPYLESLNC